MEIEITLAFKDLRNKMKVIGTCEGGEMFMGKPDRWWEAGLFRCENDHISNHLLKSDALGASVCMSCFGFVVLTFPEDVDGPIVIPEVK
jgi:hypothetical protein